MKLQKAVSVVLALVMVVGMLAAAPVTAHALKYGNWEYEIYQGRCWLTGYTGSNNITTVLIPDKVNGNNVEAINFNLGDALPYLQSLGFYEDTAITELPLLCDMPDLKGIFQVDANGRRIAGKENILPDSVTSIYERTFSGTKLQRLDTNNVTVIGDSAFEDCDSLSSVTIGKATSIGDWAFEDCDSLRSVTIGKAAAIGNAAFAKIGSSCTVSYNGSASAWSYLDFEFSPNLVVNCTDGSLGWCGGAAPEAMVYLYWSMNNSGDLTVRCVGDDIPEKQVITTQSWNKHAVKTLTLDGVYRIRENEFDNQSNDYNALKSVHVVSGLKQIEEDAFFGCGFESFEISGALPGFEIQYNAFQNCTLLKTVSLPASLTTIGLQAFENCRSLENVAFHPDTHGAAIKEYAFLNCTSLKSIVFPAGISALKAFAFYGCSALKDFYFEGTKAQWDSVNKDANWRYKVAAGCREHWRCGVTFNNNGRGTAPAAQTGLWSNEDKVVSPPMQTDGAYYSVTGWYTEPECVNRWSFDQAVPGDMTLYACWEQTSYNVRVSVEGNGTASANTPIAKVGQRVFLNYTRADNSYLKEWRVDSGNVTVNSQSFLMPEGDVAITAVFEELSMHVAVSADGSGTAYADNSDPVVGTTVTLTAVPYDNWRFKEWRVMQGGVTIDENNQFVMPAGTVWVKAVFEPAYYDITITCDTGGTAQAIPAQAQNNDMIYLTHTAERGYRFNGFEVVSGGANVHYNYWFVMPDNDVVLHAVFTPIPYSAVTVTSDENGAAHAYIQGGSDEITGAYEDDAVCLAAAPNEGYRFKEWQVVSDNVTVENNQFTMPAEAVTIKAVFERVYKINTDGNAMASYWLGWDIAYADEAAEGDLFFAVLREDATPDNGYYFTGEFTLNGESLGVGTGGGATWYLTAFQMPAHDVTLAAVQEKQQACTFDLREDDMQACTEGTLLQMNQLGILTAGDEPDTTYLDLNNSGTNDLRFRVVFDYDESGENVTDTHYYVDRLEGCDAFGAYTYDFNGISDKYSRITFLTLLVGDVNLDGKRDIRDVTAIQRHVAELAPLTGVALANADINGDGAVTIDDATHLQMYFAEYDVVLGKLFA